MDAFILLAHGSRNASAVQEIADLARNLQFKTDRRITHAYLDMCEPTLPQAIEKLVAQGTQAVDVLPLFLNAGNHVSKDVPRMIAEAREQHPRVLFRLLTHIGAHPGYLGLVEEMVANPDQYKTSL